MVKQFQTAQWDLLEERTQVRKGTTQRYITTNPTRRKDSKKYSILLVLRVILFNFYEVGKYLQEFKGMMLEMSSFKNNPNFTIYGKLGEVYDHLNWTEFYHEEIAEETLIWLCRFVFPRLILQGSKPIRLSSFISQIRKWLQFAYKIKKQFHPLGKMYQNNRKLRICLLFET